MNKLHGELCADSEFYDQSLKLTYDYDNNFWTVRYGDTIKTELKEQKLINFLNEKLKSYVLPTDEIEYDFNNIKISFLDWFLPIVEEKSEDNGANQKIIKEIMERNRLVGGEEYLSKGRALGRCLNKALYSGLEYAKNRSEYSRYKMHDSVIDEYFKFANDESIKELKVKMTDGKYFIDVLFSREI